MRGIASEEGMTKQNATISRSREASLCTMPEEILSAICERLGYRQDLAKFRLLNKQCCATANRSLFRWILLEQKTEEQLRHDIVRLAKILERNKAFGYVRALKICGGFDLDHTKEIKDTEPFVCNFEELFPICHWSPLRNIPLFCQSRGLATGFRQSESWLALENFLRSLNNLKDFIWQSTSFFDPNMLSTISECGCNLRLHIHFFNAHDLGRVKNGKFEVNHEIAALTSSPRLHQLFIWLQGDEASKVQGVNITAVVRGLFESAPNLEGRFRFFIIPQRLIQAAEA
jgi:hypothetical protein